MVTLKTSLSEGARLARLHLGHTGTRFVHWYHYPETSVTAETITLST